MSAEYPNKAEGPATQPVAYEHPSTPIDAEDYTPEQIASMNADWEELKRNQPPTRYAGLVAALRSRINEMAASKSDAVRHWSTLLAALVADPPPREKEKSQEKDVTRVDR